MSACGSKLVQLFSNRLLFSSATAVVSLAVSSFKHGWTGQEKNDLKNVAARCKYKQPSLSLLPPTPPQMQMYCLVQ